MGLAAQAAIQPSDGESRSRRGRAGSGACIPYSAPLGHRGAAHSICAALVLAAAAALATRLTPEQAVGGQTRARLWLLCAIVATTHGTGQNEKRDTAQPQR